MSITRVDIESLPRNELVAALYNNAHQVGAGFFDPLGAAGTDMTPDEAQRKCVEPGAYFHMNFDAGTRWDTGTWVLGYVHGRYMKLTFYEDSNELDVTRYEAFYGKGAALRIIEEIRSRHKTR